MFSQVSVILSTIGLMATRALLVLFTAQSVHILLECFLVTTCKQSLGQGNMFTGVCLSTGGAWSRGCLLPGGCLVRWGVPAPRGCLVWGCLVCLVPGGVPGGDPPTVTAAGGTHPTGMHSCLHLI